MKTPCDFRGSRLFAVLLATGLALSGCSSSDGADQASDAGNNTTSSPSAEPTTASPSPTPEPEELPGGGDTLFPDRRFVALYGTPSTEALGALGEQDLEGSIKRVEELADEYSENSEDPIQPAFEIITSVATAHPGEDGNYSNALPVEDLQEWVDRAKEEDIYVILDLQPGHNDFLSQAKLYEDLLKEPHVGLALDSEWRLQPGQVHGRQIGTVDAAEINEVIDWLAELTAENDLPEKMLVLHQFRTSMITNRDQVDTSHDELAVVLHADGHGTQEVKQETWSVLTEDLPEDMWPAWKNFYRQDQPMLTPAQTYDQVNPTPWLVTYQ
ncbi:hypothetical protein QDX23_10390 [Auritidibacter ignavus]|uniref:hypothetical protein n=1 Tax=Auritidibacter TaxID=1160973 RepID=UPI000D73963B|nr:MULTISPECIES: hypothetical protein [Auritidibacter]AXR74769.1 hypothetical protein DCC27_011135 [Auritidibacter sp. NML130574]WGH90508.1 hypothetical protein QDX23_10390 [Auritidibacter ignavus]